MEGGQGSRVLSDFENEFKKYLKNKSFDDLDIDMIVNKEGILGEEWHKRMWKKFCAQEKVMRGARREQYLFLTLSPDKKLRNLLPTTENCKAVNDWAQRWFGNNIKFYGKEPQYKYVLEGGSNNDHLHLHCVVKIVNSHKHAEKLKKSWAKYFPNNQLLSTLNKNKKNPPNKRGEYCSFSFNDPEILQDKLDYLDNDKKGSHENEVDLTLLGYEGQQGFITDNNQTPKTSETDVGTLPSEVVPTPHEEIGSSSIENILQIEEDEEDIEEIEINL